MTTYTIELTNGSTLTTLAPQTTDISHSPITLLGQGSLNYGETFNDNLIHILEHFANTTAPSHPITGTLWYDSAHHIFQVWNGSAWVALRPDVAFTNDAGIATALINVAPSIVGLMSNGKLVATVSASVVNSGSLPSTISFRDATYTFASRFPNGLGKGITIATDVELDPSDNTDTLVTSKWVKQQGYITVLSSGGITSSLGYVPLDPANNLSELVSASASRTNLGLGTVATQNTDAITFSGGNIDGVVIGSGTPASGRFTTIALTGSQSQHFVLAAPSGGPGAPTWRQLTSADISGVVTSGNALVPANNLSDLISVSTARTNLGLGTIATQSSSAVSVTGGTIDNVIIGGTTPAAATFTTIALTGSQSQHFVLAAPSGSSGAPSFRQLVAADISGIITSALTPSNNLSDLISVSTARTNLGLGTIAVQDSNSVSISGGNIDGTAIGSTTRSTGKFTDVTVTTSYTVGVLQVVGARQTGWTPATGSVSRAGFDPSTVTLVQLGEHVAALIGDLINHGLIGV